jgi:hypothetical protein
MKLQRRSLLRTGLQAIGTSSQSMRLRFVTLVSKGFDGAARSYPYSKRSAGRVEQVLAERKAVAVIDL